jgi:hypothetical protein
VNTKHDNSDAEVIRWFMRAGIALFVIGLVYDAVFPGPGSLAGIFVCVVGIGGCAAFLRWMRTPRTLSVVNLLIVLLAGRTFRRRLRFIRAAQRRDGLDRAGGAL